MSAFHRIDDIRDMPAPRFINFALRLPAYKGVIRALVEAAKADEADTPAARPASSQGRANVTANRDPRQNRVVDSDATTLMTDPAFAGQIEVRRHDG